MTHGELFKQWVTRNKYTLDEVAAKLGLANRSSVSQMFKTKRFYQKTRRQLREKLGFQISGTMIIDSVTESAPVYQLSHAGTSVGIPVPVGDIENTSIERVILKTLDKGNIADYKVTGDSMAPTLEDGDYIRTFEVSPSQIREGYVYVIKYDNHSKIKVKRIYNRLESYGHLILRSDNEDYNKPIYVNQSQINNVYQLLFKVSFNVPKTSDIEERLIQVELDIESLKEAVFSDS